MTGEFGFMVPIRQNTECGIRLRLTFEHNMPTPMLRPFFGFSTDDATAARFLGAILEKDSETAKRYISKNYKDDIDLLYLCEYFQRSKQYKYLTRAVSHEARKRCQCRTSSILVFGGERSKDAAILHLHMVHEPDQYGVWKIYGVEKEG